MDEPDRSTRPWPAFGPDHESEADVWLRPAAVARILMVDTKTVYNWAKRGRLPYMRTLSGQILIRQSDLRTLIDALAVREGVMLLHLPKPRRQPEPGLSSPRLRPRPERLSTGPLPRARNHLPKLSWLHDDATDCSQCQGEGWHAEIHPVGGGYQATLVISNHESLIWPAEPTDHPKTLERCKSWVRERVQRELRRTDRT